MGTTTSGQRGALRDPEKTCTLVREDGSRCLAWRKPGSPRCPHHSHSVKANAELVVANLEFRLLTALLTGSTVQQAADSIGLSYAQASTIARRPDFRDAITARRQEVADRVRDLAAEVYGRALVKTGEGVDRDDPDMVKLAVRSLSPQLLKPPAIDPAPAGPQWVSMPVAEYRERFPADQIVDAELVEDDPWQLL